MCVLSVCNICTCSCTCTFTCTYIHTHSLVQTLREHKSWVVNVFMQTYNKDRNIVSCSVAGDVRTWDPRFMRSISTLQVLPSSLNVCELHPNAPLLACASPQQAIRIYNLETEEMLNNIRYHDGFMGQRIGPTKCLAFHPYKVGHITLLHAHYVCIQGH